MLNLNHLPQTETLNAEWLGAAWEKPDAPHKGGKTSRTALATSISAAIVSITVENQTSPITKNKNIK